ncbi:MAG: hypothetical protein M9945_12660 [Aquamicrobium sp.]|uniref:hypothetical protein n=1 Tax=Aquamicrobium sp. TaxID=1872579 RepID=UPI00349EE1F3|nr:hypothetical protein [Aquamicrobium sp.]
MTEITASDVGREIAAMIRSRGPNTAIGDEVVWDAFCRLLESEANDAVDALALVTTAHALLNAFHLNGGPYSTEIQYATLSLLKRAMGALEIVTGENAREFSTEASRH